MSAIEVRAGGGSLGLLLATPAETTEHSWAEDLRAS